jgi:monofunctional glycosyltransferase
MMMIAALLTFIHRLIMAIVIIFFVSLLWGRLFPLPSTLMIADLATARWPERDWVSIDKISPSLIKAVIASEDQRFCTHWGVDLVEMTAVMSSRSRPSRGASTISMQVAKNIWLWPGRSYIRKAIEIPLAVFADLFWGKRRMMEIYLNIAEWGDGLYGAQAAAQRYFDKPASQLTESEAARLAATLPNPIRRNPLRAGGAAARIIERASQLSTETDCIK